MKVKIACLLLLFFPVLAHADYARMNKTRAAYTPPAFLNLFLESKTKETPSLTGRGAENGAGPFSINSQMLDSQIQALKKTHEKGLDPKGISFLSSYDPAMYAKLVDLSSDSLAIGSRIGQKVVLKEIEILSALRNPAVLAAQKKVAAELLSYDQIMGLDDTLKQYDGFTKGINNKAGPVSMKTSIKQGWPFPGLTSLKGKIIQEQVAIAIEKMNMVQKDVITQTRTTYWDLVLVDESVIITAETIDAFERLRDVATILYKSGKTSFQDIIKINIQMAILKEDLITLASRRKTFEAGLLELLNLSNTARVGKTGKPDAHKKVNEPDSLYHIARENSQELKVIKHRIGKINYMIQMAEAMIQEPFTLGLSQYENEIVTTVGTAALKDAFAKKTMASMKNNQPQKPWYGLSEPWLNQTRQSLLSLKETRTREENATDRMVRDAWFLVDKNRRELVLYEKKILPLSKSALDVSEREYESGSIPFSQAIDSYTFWLTVKLTIAKKQSGLGRSIAALEKKLGVPYGFISTGKGRESLIIRQA